jgi:hypothetical protein
MKKIFFLVLFMVPFVIAQQGNYGNISLVFNGQKINLPVSYITIVRDKSIIVKFKAEKTDSLSQQIISFQLAFKELSAKPDAELLDGTRINVRTRDYKNGSGSDLALWMEDKNESREEKYERTQYSFFNKGERISWGINSLSMKINTTSVEYKDGALHIKGELNGTFKSSLAPAGKYAEITDCNFELII